MISKDNPCIPRQYPILRKMSMANTATRVSEFKLFIENRAKKKGRRGICVNVYFHYPVYGRPVSVAFFLPRRICCKRL